MNIIQLSLKEIHPYKNNPRKNDSAAEAVAASIKPVSYTHLFVICLLHPLGVR